MTNKIVISVLNPECEGPAVRAISAKVSLSVYDKIEAIARATNRTRSDVAKIILSHAIGLVEVEKPRDD